MRAPGHPFREALAQACGDSVRVCDLDEVATLSPQDFDACAVVVVATMQSFRVEDTAQRNVYAFSEAFEPHSRGVPAAALRVLHVLPDACVTVEEAGSAKAGREMLARFVGRPRWGLANWLALRQPYVIVDEAHNTKTERSFGALKRLNEPGADPRTHGDAGAPARCAQAKPGEPRPLRRQRGAASRRRSARSTAPSSGTRSYTCWAASQ